MRQRAASFHQVLSYAQTRKCFGFTSCNLSKHTELFSRGCWRLWDLYPLTDSLSQGANSNSKLESLLPSSSSMNHWAPLELQVLLERICVNYSSSALNMVTAPVSSTLYFVTAFSLCCPTENFFAFPRKQRFSLPSWREQISCPSPLRFRVCHPYVLAN